MEKLSLEQISNIICSYFDVTKEYIDQNIRDRKVVEKRQFAHYFAKKYTTHSLSEIGMHFGDKDHCTTLHSCKSINNLIETDPKKLKIYNEIETIIVYSDRKLKLKSRLLTNMIKKLSKIFPLKVVSELLGIFKLYKDLIIKL